MHYSKSSNTANLGLPLIIPHAYTKRKQSRNSIQNSSDEERQAVAKLTDWEKRDTNYASIQSVSEAKIALKKRISGEDLVEEIKYKRKHKSNLPVLNSHKLLPIIKSIKQRQEKKELEENFKERCRYHRLYEEDLNNTYKQLTSELEGVKKTREELREETVEIKKKVAEFGDYVERLKENLVEFEAKGRGKATQESLAVWMNRRDQMKEEVRKSDVIKGEMQKNAVVEVAVRADKLAELDLVIREIRKKIRMVKATQVNHFRNLLKEGKDTKGEGLQWIVKTLWKIGETVSFNSFPLFLDEDSVRFILFIAQKNLEIEEILDKIVSPSIKPMNFAKNSLSRLNNVKQRLAELTKSLNTNKPEYVYNNKNQKLSVKWVPCGKLGDSMISDRLNDSNIYYENYVIKMKEIIKEAIENEVQRLTVEYSLHGYEERFKVPIKELIGAIAGTESLDKHLATVAKHKRTLSGILDGNRSASLG